MKTLVVYYSFEGSCMLVADMIKTELNAEVILLKPKKEPKSKGFSKFIWGSKQVMMGETPELSPFDVKLADYDLIILGSPVWAGTFTPAMRTFLSENKITNKKVALYCCSSARKGQFFEHIRAELSGCEIIGELEFSNASQIPSKTADTAKKWARECVAKVISK